MKVRKKFPSKVACVHCNGGCRANQSPEGYDLCLYGCTGCGACMEVCRFGAISLNSYGVAEVDESRCIGCGACYQACPQRVIHLRLEDNPIVVLCSNKDARCRDVCAVSCIGCGLCERTCPAGAIVVSENRAFIYADKCLSCGMCAMACPRNVIHDKRGLRVCCSATRRMSFPFPAWRSLLRTAGTTARTICCCRTCAPATL